MNQIIFNAEPERQEVILKCLIEAGRKRIFKVYNNAELIPHWWGPADLITRVERMDVQPGGLWRFIQNAPDGQEYAFHGVYHDIVEPELVVFTFEFEDLPGHVALETILLEECNGATLLTDQTVFQSVEHRDKMLQSGMETGAIESMQRLVKLLEKP